MYNWNEITSCVLLTTSTHHINVWHLYCIFCDLLVDHACELYLYVYIFCPNKKDIFTHMNIIRWLCYWSFFSIQYIPHFLPVGAWGRPVLGWNVANEIKGNCDSSLLKLKFHKTPCSSMILFIRISTLHTFLSFWTVHILWSICGICGEKNHEHSRANVHRVALSQREHGFRFRLDYLKRFKKQTFIWSLCITFTSILLRYKLCIHHKDFHIF